MAKQIKFEIYPNVILGKNVKIDPFCLIGKPPRNKKSYHLKTIIGNNAIIRSGTVIYAGTKIGHDFHAGHGVLIREDNVIGDNVSVGTNSVLEPKNKIGNNVRIHSGCFMESATIEDNVFIGPNAVFTDDPHPPCPRYKDCKGGVIVKESAKIGANSTLLPGIIIGNNALVGAGTVVAKNVRKNTVVAGSPAKRIKSVKDLKCFKNFFQKPYDWEFHK